MPRNLRNREENAPSRDRLPAAAGPGANVPRAEARGCRAGAPEGGGGGGQRLRARGWGARLYKLRGVEGGPGLERRGRRGARRR